jgi:hypothetical protein
MAKPKKKEKSFKYALSCKLPSCRKPFKTNLGWKEFHHSDCQRAWQKLLRRSQADLIIEVEQCKADIIKIKKKIGMPTKREMEWIDK